jgi:hypothetical protein
LAGDLAFATAVIENHGSDATALQPRINRPVALNRGYSGIKCHFPDGVIEFKSRYCATVIRK